VGVASRVAAYVGDRIREGIFPGAVWLVSEGSRILAKGALGHAALVPRRVATSPATLYDLASLTKPLAAGLLAVLLEREGRLRLDDPVTRHLPRWGAGDDRDRITLVDLLAHRSGLPAWLPLYLHAPPGDRDRRLEILRATPLDRPPGAAVAYSDPGYILLGLTLEAAGGAFLDRLFQERVTGPLGIGDLLFRPGPGLRARCAATEEGNGRERRLAGDEGDRYNGWRTGVIRGEVHDHNAWTLGGVSGHAGLFGTARAVHRLALEFLGIGTGFLDETQRDRFRANLTPGLQEDRSVGFQLASTRDCSAGPALSPAAFGHSGFTGTSLWIDPETGRIFVLLTNRVHPRFREIDMNAVRRAFHSAASP
jgi:CubicO group peptidase (beta-lactamase class C family)